MNTVFPFGFPFPTVLYLSLYILTLAIHVVFMNYVLAGSGYLAFASLLGGRQWSSDSVARVMRDWMPFALGATITAGIAPILFVQVLYQRAFYTANLLLFHRWMSILPVLIVAFYLLYLLKARRVETWPRIVQQAVAFIAFLCIAFTGYSWAENHSLALDHERWASFYESQPVAYFNAALPPRFGMWMFGAVATMSLLVLWQLRFYQLHVPPSGWPVVTLPLHIKRMGTLALIGLSGAVACAIWHLVAAGPQTRGAITSLMAMPYLALATVGLAIEFRMWLIIRRSAALTTKPLAITSAGLGLCILGIAVVRESIRIHALDMEALSASHARAASVGGFWAFAAFLVLNAVLIWWSLQLVRKATPMEPGSR